MTAARPEAGTSLVGYWTNGGGQYVDFIGVDGHVHQLAIYPGASWADTDLTALTGAQPPAVQSGLSGFWNTPNDVQVFYFGAGTDNHVFQLLLGPGDPHWVHTDLTTLVDGVVPVGRAPAAMWASTAANTCSSWDPASTLKSCTRGAARGAKTI